MAELYASNLKYFVLKPLVFNTSDSTSKLSVNISLSNLQYEKKQGSLTPCASYSLLYQLYPSLESYHLIDSASVYYCDSVGYGINLIHSHEFELKTSAPNDYIVKITLTDLNSQQTYIRIQNLDRSHPTDRSNFVLLDENKSMIPRNYVFPGEKTCIKTLLKQQKLLVKAYKKDFPMAQPPFSESVLKPFNFKPDSVFSLQLHDGETEYFDIPKNYFYLFQVDSASSSGFSVFARSQNFPEVSTIEEMFPCTKYITTKSEFDEILKAKDKKLAMDKFWLSLGGTPERAKKLIRNYYNRIQDANCFFTSYTDGWKTDRGMMYIIFGPPSIVYIGSESEKWIYGNEKSSLSISYYFNKVENPFCDNDYVLDRNSSFKSYWYQGVDGWRQ